MRVPTPLEPDYRHKILVSPGLKYSSAYGLSPSHSITFVWFHYNDVMIDTMASQITSLTIFYLTVYSGADHRKHQSSASLAFVRGIHRWLVNSLHKWPVTRKMFTFQDVIVCRPYWITQNPHLSLSLQIFCHHCGAIPCPVDHEEERANRLRDLEFVRDLVEVKKELETKCNKVSGSENIHEASVHIPGAAPKHRIYLCAVCSTEFLTFYMNIIHLLGS